MALAVFHEKCRCMDGSKGSDFSGLSQGCQAHLAGRAARMTKIVSGCAGPGSWWTSMAGPMWGNFVELHGTFLVKVSASTWSSWLPSSSSWLEMLILLGSAMEGCEEV